MTDDIYDYDRIDQDRQECLLDEERAEAERLLAIVTEISKNSKVVPLREGAGTADASSSPQLFIEGHQMYNMNLLLEYLLEKEIGK